jgi:ADP-heptose:LPS heptosyltransferase
MRDKYLIFIKSFSDIFLFENDISNKSYDIVIRNPHSNHFQGNFVSVINNYNVKYEKLYYIFYGKLFNYHQNNSYNKIQEKILNCEMKINNNCFKDIHKYMKNKFPIINKFNLKKNAITISIGTSGKKYDGLTDKGFQKIISRLIQDNTNIQFCIVGFSNELNSNELKNCLQKNYSHVLNLINKDDGLFDVIDIIQSSKIFISRCSGLLHLAGLFNSNIIYFKNYNRNFIKNIYYNYLNSNVKYYSIENEEEHMYYHEKWAPISLNYVRITEYKKDDYLYNNFDYVYFYLSEIIQNKLNIKKTTKNVSEIKKIIHAFRNWLFYETYMKYILLLLTQIYIFFVQHFLLFIEIIIYIFN